MDMIRNRLIKRKEFEIHQPKSTLAVDLTNIEFYSNQNAILKNLQLTIEKYKLVALIGPSSSGKSVNHYLLNLRIY
jgi:ABC-type phosphate transport system ATPase subunit